MIQIEDDVYAKLKKDADDNRQIRNIARMIIVAIIFCILFFVWGVPLINLDIQRRSAEMQTQIAITQAETNKRVMEIEKSDLSNAEYFKWLEVRSK